MFIDFQKNKTFKKTSDLLKHEIWDGNSLKIINTIATIDHKLPYFTDDAPHIKLRSTSKETLSQSKHLFFQNFYADINLAGGIIYINKDLDLDSQVIFSILAYFSSQAQLKNWPELPHELNRDTEMSIQAYNHKVHEIEKYLQKEMTCILNKIKNETSLNLKLSSYPISNKTNTNMYFGINAKKYEYGELIQQPIATSVPIIN